MQKIDMHFHTKLSDGGKSNDEIIKEAKEKQIKFLSATDHDIINTDFVLSSQINGIKSTYGVEMSAEDDKTTGKHLHLTCYSHKFGKELINILENTREKRKLKIKKQIEKLQKNGFNIEYDKFIEFCKNLNTNIDNINNFHIEHYIFEKQQNLDKLLISLVGEKLKKGDFLQQILKKTGKYRHIGWEQIDKYEPTIERIGKICRKNNYFLSLAHPNFTFKDNKKKFFNFIEEYQDILNGLEINSKADEEWTNLTIQTATKYGLILTFGSDFHHKGESKSHGDLGDMNDYVSEDIVEENFEDFLYELDKSRDN